MGYSPWGHKELDTTEQPHLLIHLWESEKPRVKSHQWDSLFVSKQVT